MDGIEYKGSGNHRCQTTANLQQWRGLVAEVKNLLVNQEAQDHRSSCTRGVQPVKCVGFLKTVCSGDRERPDKL